MAESSVADKVRSRLPGVPRTGREALSSLQVLAHLRSIGWHRNVAGGTPANSDAKPIPWLQYSATALLERIASETLSVIEFGSGGSTEWLAERFGRVRAIEHDADWHAHASSTSAAEVLLRECSGDWFTLELPSPYLEAALEEGAVWDLAIIDGMGRQTCAENIHRIVRSGGLVILDDTHNPKSLGAQVALENAGLGRIDFWGFKPGIGTVTCTSAFSDQFDVWLAN